MNAEPLQSKWYLIPASEVVVQENRIRQVFKEDKLSELSASIRDLGLLHLPVVRREGDKHILVAGESRLKAMQILWSCEESFSYLGMPIPVGAFPFALLEDLPTATARRIELEENIKRNDLTWQEKTKALAELHSLLGGTLQDTATAIGMATAKAVSASVTLAKYLDNPIVGKAADPKAAMKALVRDTEKKMTALLASSTDVSKSKHKALCGLAEELLPQLPSNSFNVVITDPPYGIGASEFKANHISHDYVDSWTATQLLLSTTVLHITHLTTAQAHCYMFCDVQRFMEIRGLFEAQGWDVWPRPLIWVKDKGHLPRPHHGPRHMYEAILYAIKGDLAVTGLFPDVLMHPTVDNPRHAAEKPVALYNDLLRRSVKPGDHILDPFCGSGTVFKAAHALQCEAVGIDLDTGLALETIGGLL